MAAPDPKQELIALIADSFTVETLREFVRRGPSGPDIEGRISWEEPQMERLAREFLEESESEGAFDAGFFARLTVHAGAERPYKLSEQLGYPWNIKWRAPVLASFLLEALTTEQLMFIFPSFAKARPGRDQQRDRSDLLAAAVFLATQSGHINANFFQTLLTIVPEQEATLARIAALWGVELTAPPPPPAKTLSAQDFPQQFVQDAQSIELTENLRPIGGAAVLVLGSASNYPDHMAQAAAAVGQAIAELKLTLVTGDSSGVDLGVARAFGDRSRAMGRDLNLLKVVTPSWPTTFEGGQTLRRPDAAEESVRRASVVVLFDGGEGTRQMHDIARRLGRPVLPLAATGAYPQAVFEATRRSGAFPGRLGAQDFAALQDLPRPERFAQILTRTLPPRVAIEPPPLRATLTADQPEAHEDKLNLADQARIFAEALASREVKPPLAIGLLGEWGSGKSFFMRQIQADVRRLSAGRDGAFYRNVCQIVFNAWHYVDANPWASLAGRIFDGIAEHVFGDAQEQLEERRRLLRSKLASTQREEEAAKEAQAEWEARLGKARERLLLLEKNQEAYVRSARLLLDRRVWKTLSERGSVATLRGKAEEAAAALGLDIDIPDEETSAEFEKLKAQVAKARVAAAQIQAVPGALGALGALRRPRGWLEWALIGVVLLGGVAVSVLLTVFEQAWWHQVATLLAQVVIILGFVGERAWKLVQASRAIVGFVEAADAEAEAVRQAILADPPQDLIDARAAVALAETETEAARVLVADIEQRLTETRQQISDIQAGKLAYDFIRGAGEAYLSEQGIVSKVRRDLETLQDRLADWQREAEGPEADGGAPPIDRIILYIDDLDRCRPSQVVQALQAVHLLLAKPLFMVVVGVDPRWLERSLEAEYRELLTGGGGETGAPPAASPRDYLEKIFQVPYTLPAVDAEGFQGLVDHLLPSREEVELEEAARAQAAAEAERRAAARRAAGMVEAAPGLGEDEVTESEGEVGDGSGDAAGCRNDAARGDEADREDEAVSDAETDDAPKDTGPRFFIEAWERAHLHRLSPLVGTPRDILRFINIYRLLRISAPDPAAFVADRPEAEHRAAQLLLALNVGCPELAAELLRLLADPRRLRRAMGRPPSAWSDVVKALEPYRDGDVSRDPLVMALTDRTPVAWRQLEQAWPLLRNLAHDHPDSLAVWQRWAARVARYSFLAGR